MSPEDENVVPRAEPGDGASVLIVTMESLSGEMLRTVVDEVRRVSPGRAPHARVVAPILAESALKHQAGDIDSARGPALERLEQSLRALNDADIEASGEVGDADPAMAISDELQKLEVDRILLVSHARDEDAAYAEKELLERVKREFEPPVTEVRVADDGDQVVERRRAGAGTERAEEGRRISRNLPPLRLQDTLGLGVAVLGTIVLIVLAASCGDPGGSGAGTSISACGVRYLLAGAFFLINLGHVGALLLMESVGYRGPFERFFARISLLGTPAAIAASLLIAD
jgi:hypothetical protein